MKINVEQPPPGLTQIFLLRDTGADTSNYDLYINTGGGDGNDWVVQCSDDIGTWAGDFTGGITYDLVLDIDIANGDMDLYIDGESTPTVPCDGSTDAGTSFDGIAFHSGWDSLSELVFDSIQICDVATASGVCSCS
jgi:hypothetical protein